MLATWLGQILTGHVVYNEELSDAGAGTLSLLAYLGSGHFVSATFENWESEFLQMGMYVLLSVSLRLSQTPDLSFQVLGERQTRRIVTRGMESAPAR